jgi:hypothetical protein
VAWVTQRRGRISSGHPQGRSEGATLAERKAKASGKEVVGEEGERHPARWSPLSPCPCHKTRQLNQVRGGLRPCLPVPSILGTLDCCPQSSGSQWEGLWSVGPVPSLGVGGGGLR